MQNEVSAFVLTDSLVGGEVTWFPLSIVQFNNSNYVFNSSYFSAIDESTCATTGV